MSPCCRLRRHRPRHNGDVAQCAAGLGYNDKEARMRGQAIAGGRSGRRRHTAGACRLLSKSVIPDRGSIDIPLHDRNRPPDRRRTGLAAGRGVRARAAAQAARRIRRAGKNPRPARDLHRSGAPAQGSARPRAAVRPAGPRQDDARAHHRARDGRQPAPDLRPGARARRRSGRDADQSRTERRAVHRRDPSPVAGGRGNPVSGARGLTRSTS